MVADDIGELIEPPQAQAREHLPLVRNLRIEHPVIGRDPVRGDHEQLLRARGIGGIGRNVEVADLPRIHVLPARQHRRVRCGGGVSGGEFDATGGGRIGDIGAVLLTVPLDLTDRGIGLRPRIVQVIAEGDD